MNLTRTIKAAAAVPLVLVLATVVGGLLGGLADVLALDVIQGTPLGPGSTLSPLLWTGIGLGALYAIAEVFD